MSVSATDIKYGVITNGKKRHIWLGNTGMSLCGRARRKDMEKGGSGLPVCPECREALTRKASR